MPRCILPEEAQKSKVYEPKLIPKDKGRYTCRYQRRKSRKKTRKGQTKDAKVSPKEEEKATPSKDAVSTKEEEMVTPMEDAEEMEDASKEPAKTRRLTSRKSISGRE